MFTCGDSQTGRIQMGDLTCAGAQDLTAEFALGILSEPERGSLVAHMARCPRCQADAESLSQTAALLLQVVPGSEPPLGFDQRVLRRTRPGRRHVRLAVAAIGSMAAAISGVIGLTMASSRQTERTGIVTYLRHGPIVVGTFTSSGRPTWVSMTVRGVSESGLVTCELVGHDGAVMTLGTFDLVDGSGSWSAPDPAGLAGDTGVRLVDPQGDVVASAPFV